MRLIFSTFSECGPRDKNEDYIKCCSEGDSGIFVLCDGMGGHDNGEVASSLVAETIVHSFLESAQTLSLEERVISSYENAKSEIDNFMDIGTTVASVAIKDNFAFLPIVVIAESITSGMDE